MKKLNYELLEPNELAQLGLIVLQSDVTIEDEFRYYFSDQPVSIFVNRIPFENEVNAETLSAMESYIGQTMSLFPVDTHFDALAYACTSGAMHIGGNKIAQLAVEKRSCSSVSNPLDAAIDAFEAKGVQKIAYLGPYSEAVCNAMINRFNDAGIDVVAAASYHESQDKLVGRISPSSIQKDAIALATEHSEIEAVFISCTNMKCAHIIPAIEAQTGIAALSSNQVLAWAVAKSTGLTLSPLKGSLFGAIH